MLSYDAPMAAAKSTKDVPTASSTETPATATTPGAASASIANGSMNLINGHHAPSPYKHHHIWLVTGPAGCGKTTVAEHLSQHLAMPYIEGDAYHPEANIKKMASGTPLTDADRWDWLTRLRDESTHLIGAGSPGVVLTCSALKRKYRDVIRVAGYYDPTLLVHFIYLDASEEVLLQRVAARQGHYMGANMVHSQFQALERPEEDERDVVKVDVSRPLEEVTRDACDRVMAMMEEDKA